MVKHVRLRKTTPLYVIRVVAALALILLGCSTTGTLSARAAEPVKERAVFGEESQDGSQYGYEWNAETATLTLTGAAFEQGILFTVTKPVTILLKNDPAAGGVTTNTIGYYLDAEDSHFATAIQAGRDVTILPFQEAGSTSTEALNDSPETAEQQSTSAAPAVSLNLSYTTEELPVGIGSVYGIYTGGKVSIGEKEIPLSVEIRNPFRTANPFSTYGIFSHGLDITNVELDLQYTGSGQELSWDGRALYSIGDISIRKSTVTIQPGNLEKCTYAHFYALYADGDLDITSSELSLAMPKSAAYIAQGICATGKVTFYPQTKLSVQNTASEAAGYVPVSAQNGFGMAVDSVQSMINVAPSLSALQADEKALDSTTVLLYQKEENAEEKDFYMETVSTFPVFKVVISDLDAPVAGEALDTSIKYSIWNTEESSPAEEAGSVSYTWKDGEDEKTAEGNADHGIAYRAALTLPKTSEGYAYRSDTSVVLADAQGNESAVADRIYNGAVLGQLSVHFLRRQGIHRSLLTRQRQKDRMRSNMRILKI